MTTMIPEITSLVKVPAGLTSDLTLPGMDLPGMDVTTLLGGIDGLTTELPALPGLDLPSVDVMTLLGGVDGLTTELPAMPTDVPGLDVPSLEPPDVDTPDPVFITDVISPPEPEATDPPDVTTDSGGRAAGPSVGFAVSAAGVGALGFMAFVL